MNFVIHELIRENLFKADFKPIYTVSSEKFTDDTLIDKYTKPIVCCSDKIELPTIEKLQII